MPTCLAIGCANTTGKTKVKKSYYRVPRPTCDFEKARAARWLENLQLGHTVETFDFTKDKVVCDNHFHVDCYVSRDDYVHPSQLAPDARLRKRALREGAIPTIFANCLYDVIDMDGTKAVGDPSTTIENYFLKQGGFDIEENALPSQVTDLHKSTNRLDVGEEEMLVIPLKDQMLYDLSMCSQTSSVATPPSLPQAQQPATAPSMVVPLNHHQQQTSTPTILDGSMNNNSVTSQPEDLAAPICMPPLQPTSSALRSQKYKYNNARPSTSLVHRFGERANQNRPSREVVSSTTQSPYEPSTCTLCMDGWKQRNEACPTCDIERKKAKHNKSNSSRPTNPGAMHDSKMKDEVKVKSAMRRQRIKMLFEDFQNEFTWLEKKHKELAKENARLKPENERFWKRICEQDKRYIDSLQSSTSVEIAKRTVGESAITSVEGGSTERESTSVDRGSTRVENGPIGLELSSELQTIMKLTNKLQDMMTRNDQLSAENTLLKMDVKNLQSEKERHLKEINTLKDDLRANQSRDDEGSMVTAHSKIESYEREIQEWKKALQKADAQIDELTSRTENSRKNGSTRSTSPSSVTRQEQQCESSIENESMRIADTNETTRTADKHSPESMLLDPNRFPACRKLMELTKARQETGTLGNAAAVSPPPSNPNRQLIQNVSLKSTAPLHQDVQGHSPPSRDSIYDSHNNFVSSVENQESQFYRQNENSNDITVVIPSNDFSENGSSSRRSENHDSYQMNALNAWSAEKKFALSHGDESRVSSALTNIADSSITFDTACRPPLIKKVKTESIF